MGRLFATQISIILSIFLYLSKRRVRGCKGWQGFLNSFVHGETDLIFLAQEGFQRWIHL